MANIKQLIPAEPGWEGIYVRDDATWESQVKSAAAPLIAWALIDDADSGDTAVHPVLAINGFATTRLDLDARFLGSARQGDWASRLTDHWEGLAGGYIEEYGEPGASSGEGEGEGEGEEGSGEGAEETE